MPPRRLHFPPPLSSLSWPSLCSVSIYQACTPITVGMSLGELGLMTEPSNYPSTLSAWDEGPVLVAILPYDRLSKFFLKDADLCLRVNTYLKEEAWPKAQDKELILATADAAMTLQVI